MSWRGLERGIKALKAGHPVIFSSNGHFYFNNYQVEDVTNEPVATGSLVEMQKVYEADWNAAALPADERERILGAEACLWTSYVDNEEILEYMMLPRLAAFAEVAWTGDRGLYGLLEPSAADVASVSENGLERGSPLF